MFNLITQQYIKGSDYEKSFKAILIIASRGTEQSITARSQRREGGGSLRLIPSVDPD